MLAIQGNNVIVSDDPSLRKVDGWVQLKDTANIADRYRLKFLPYAIEDGDPYVYINTGSKIRRVSINPSYFIITNNITTGSFQQC